MFIFNCNLYTVKFCIDITNYFKLCIKGLIDYPKNRFIKIHQRKVKKNRQKKLNDGQNDFLGTMKIFFGGQLLSS